MTYTKTCPVCGKEYETSSYRMIYCSEKCAEEANRRRAKKRARRLALGASPPWKIPKRCAVCGVEFMPSTQKQIICRSPECRAEAQRQRTRGYRPLDWKKPRQCIICGTEFMPINERMTTCGNPACKRARKLAQQKAYNHAHRAEIREKEKERRGAEQTEKKPKPKSLRDAVRMPDQAKPKRSRKGPKPGSLEWCVKEADKRGMSYGQFVAAMESGVIEA